MVKYEPIYDGNNIGVALKNGKEGIIEEIAIRGAGELGAVAWIIYKKDGSKYALPLSHQFLAGKSSLGDLTRKEFDNLVQSFGFLPEEAKKELFQCYVVLATWNIYYT